MRRLERGDYKVLEEQLEQEISNYEKHHGELPEELKKLLRKHGSADNMKSNLRYDPLMRGFIVPFREHEGFIRSVFAGQKALKNILIYE